MCEVAKKERKKKGKYKEMANLGTSRRGSISCPRQSCVSAAQRGSWEALRLSVLNPGGSGTPPCTSISLFTRGQRLANSSPSLVKHSRNQGLCPCFEQAVCFSEDP